MESRAVMFVFKKKFGQNFLINQHIINSITDCFNNFEEVVEIGPGKGALTKSLISKGKKVSAVEIDIDCVNSLKNLDINLIHADVLEYTLPKNKPIIGNLPYNISSKIIEKIVYNPVPYAVLMFQKEVANILTGVEYGRLTVFVQSRYKISKLMDVKPGNFFPVPKVNSQVLIFQRIYDYENIDLKKLKNILFIFFNNKRKMIGHIKRRSPKLYDDILAIGVDARLRAQNLQKEKYYELVLLN